MIELGCQISWGRGLTCLASRLTGLCRIFAWGLLGFDWLLSIWRRRGWGRKCLMGWRWEICCLWRMICVFLMVSVVGLWKRASLRMIIFILVVCFLGFCGLIIWILSLLMIFSLLTQPLACRINLFLINFSIFLSCQLFVIFFKNQPSKKFSFSSLPSSYLSYPKSNFFPFP